MKTSRRLSTPSKTLVVVASTATVLSSGRRAFVLRSSFLFSPPPSHYSIKPLRLMMTPTTTITSTQNQAVRRRRSSSALSTTTTTFNNNYDDSGSSSRDVGDQHYRYFILRHGETDANASGQIQGSSDISRLTELGKRQAIQAAKSCFNNQRLPTIHQVYVSPLTRAQETLSILRQHTTGRRCCLLPDVEEKIVTMEELREIDLYEWEGRDKNDLKVNDPIAYKAWTTGDSYGFEVSGRKPLLETWTRANEIWNKIRSSQSKSQQQTTTTTTSEDQQHYRRRKTATTTNNNTANTTTPLNNNTLLVCHGTLGQALLCTAFRWDPTHFRKHEFPNCGIVEILWKPEQDSAFGFRWHHPEKTVRRPRAVPRRRTKQHWGKERHCKVEETIMFILI